jgi:hypothetical protein
MTTDTTEATPTTIAVRYSTVDRFSEIKRFTTIEAARKFAQRWIGATPEIGWGYAISDDGIGKIEVRGARLADLFPEAAQ